MTIYISGRITGDENYKAKFQKAREDLENKGHVVLSPTMIDTIRPLPYWDYMAIDFVMIQLSDAVYFLRDWENSPGARAEKRIAEKYNKLVIYEPRK